MEKFYPLIIDRRSYLNNTLISQKSLDRQLREFEKKIKLVFVKKLIKPSEEIVEQIISLSKIKEN
jgi:hypothetical protein